MTAFTVVYIQLTASQVGAKYLKRDLIVMNESLEDLKAIIYNAPEGATLYDGEYFKFECDDYHRWVSICDIHDWYVDIEPSCDVRSLSDIERIIELMEQVKADYEAYARIESIKQKYNAENKQMKELLKDIIENEDLDDCRFLLADKILKGE